MNKEQHALYKVLEAEAHYLGQQAAAYGELRDLCMEDNDSDGYRQNELCRLAAELRAQRVRAELEELKVC